MNKETINKIAKTTEKVIVYSLIIMMALVLILATVELGYFLVKTLLDSEYLLIDLDYLLDLFGVFLLVLIGIELLDTIKVYLKEHVVHVEVIMLVAIIAIARKVVVLKIEELSGEMILGISALIVSLSIGYYLIKKAGLLVIDFENKKPDVDVNSPDGSTKLDDNEHRK